MKKEEPFTKDHEYYSGLETSRSFSSSSNDMDSAGKSQGPLKPIIVRPEMLQGKKQSEKTQKQNPGNSAKKIKAFLRFLFSNFGMLLLTLLYILGGAYLFQTLEQHTEIQNCQMGQGQIESTVSSYRQQLFNYIYFNITLDPWLPVDNSTTVASLSSTKDGPDVFNPNITAIFQQFRTDILAIYSSTKYKGLECVEYSTWNLPSAMLFTLTVVTTIGKLFQIKSNQKAFFKKFDFSDRIWACISSHLGRSNSYNVLRNYWNSLIFANFSKYK